MKSARDTIGERDEKRTRGPSADYADYQAWETVKKVPHAEKRGTGTRKPATKDGRAGRGIAANPFPDIGNGGLKRRGA
jgi:hypothetical protein